MKLFLQRVFCVLLFFSASFLQAEKVADLPLPTSYVNDFADVLSPGTRQSVEDLCRQLHEKANAEVAVVTIHRLEDDQSIEEFTGQLEEKWKLGKKGSDRSAIYVIVTETRKMRVEVGYGLEGVLNDAKVGRILDDAVPSAKSGDWDAAARTGAQEIGQDIAADAQVTLDPTPHRYHREAAGNSGQLGMGQIILGVLFLAVLAVLVLTGNFGWAWMLLWSVMGGGGGGGGGGRDDDDRGGGFGGMGGGSSGGGGASRDF